MLNIITVLPNDIAKAQQDGNPQAGNGTPNIMPCSSLLGAKFTFKTAQNAILCLIQGPKCIFKILFITFLQVQSVVYLALQIYIKNLIYNQLYPKNIKKCYFMLNPGPQMLIKCILKVLLMLLLHGICQLHFQLYFCI